MIVLDLGFFDITWAEYYERARILNQKLALAEWSKELSDKEMKVGELLQIPGGLSRIAAAMLGQHRAIPRDLLLVDRLQLTDIPIYDRDIPTDYDPR